ncbi:hypothetical protein PT974_01527 [Cladobotryum mycophilum]|uniref:Peptidase C14 caspase domain-containing protein n=1 Tax=Cladobotryum mycophilum TaxID=491253 RepID=A0ABR0T3V5_9HYPO
MPMRYALLVGVDHYLNDGSRRHQNGNTVSLKDLNGCVNDVESIRELLERVYSFEDISMLVSPSCAPLESKTTDAVEPTQLSDPDRLPTFSNMKREFESIRDKAVSGDFFFFHFSGHGARIDRVARSPLGREKDPSLMTADYCCGKPAVRGWQLNRWLKRLNQKGIQVVVSLDSCHSGGAWRGDDAKCRTPDNWSSVPNLPVDELAASQEEEDDAAAESASRTAELETSWSLNPEAFTLMTACSTDQKAAERNHNGKIGGAFTHELLKYLKDNEYYVTYRMTRDHLQAKLNPQTPVSLLWEFGALLDIPLGVQFEGCRAIIPAGRAHGVHQGSEFAPFPLTSTLTLSIDYVEEFKSSARISAETREVLGQYKNMVMTSRWSLGKGCTLRVLVDPVLGSEFRDVLRRSLESRIVSAVQVAETSQGGDDDGGGGGVDSGNGKLMVFKLQSDGEEAIKIVGPEWLVGCSEPIWALKPGSYRYDDNENLKVEELAAEVATPLVHLARFGQTLHIRPEEEEEEEEQAPFEVTLVPDGGKPEADTYPAEQKFRYTFRNTSDQDLHFTLLNITSEFQIQQLFPSTDSRQTVAPGRSKSFKFAIFIPTIPPEFQHLVRPRASFRDIMRTLVSRDNSVSWRTLEMPSIWEADKVKAIATRSEDKRNAVLEVEEEGWWVCDRYITTSTEVE